MQFCTRSVRPKTSSIANPQKQISTFAQASPAPWSSTRGRPAQRNRQPTTGTGPIVELTNPGKSSSRSCVNPLCPEPDNAPDPRTAEEMQDVTRRLRSGGSVGWVEPFAKPITGVVGRTAADGFRHSPSKTGVTTLMAQPILQKI